MYQFQRNNQVFVFTTRKEAVEWAQTYLLDNGIEFTQPVQLDNNMWRIEVLNDQTSILIYTRSYLDSSTKSVSSTLFIDSVCSG